MYNILIALLTLTNLSDIYQFSMPAIGGGTTIHFSDFKGKKILVVNTASGSPYAEQYARLEQLYQQYKDKLVIVAVPSNDFQHETGSEQAIQNQVSSMYHVHYLLTGKASVTGAGACDLYRWLTTGPESGAMSSTVIKDFQKYLVGTDGHVIAYFNGAVDPMDQSIQDLINIP